jgi:hypothetical protein
LVAGTEEERRANSETKLKSEGEVKARAVASGVDLGKEGVANSM